MDTERWELIQNLFHEAAARPEGERLAFLETASGGETEIVEEVLSLLEEGESGTSLLNEDLCQIARSLVTDSEGLPAARVGPYRILGQIGQGGMGMVYLAEREDLGSRVAIKVLPNAWMSPSRRERFAAETRTLSRLNHPSIARLYDAGALPDGTPWFAMEYVQGLPLSEYCEKSKLSLSERLGLFRSVCEAVQFAHSQAVLHRDLKPTNILVREDGEIRLLDFGIAKHLDQVDDTADATRTGLRLATPAYAAPEQLRGDPPAIQCDVYSLGVILYELLAGRRPFDVSGDVLSVTRPVEPPSTGGSRVLAASKTSWADLDVLCLTAMHPDPERRYQSAEALIRDVDHFLQNEPLEARPDDFLYRLRKFVTRRRHALTAAAAVVVLFTGTAGYFTYRLAIARDAAQAEAARAKRIQQFMLHLFEGDDPNAGPAEDLRVVTLVDRSAREARTLSSDPSVQADLYQTLGDVYEQLGKFDQADELMRSALEIRRKLPKPDAAQVSESLVALGLLRVDQGKLEDAEKLVREGLELARAKLPARDSAIARATSALGRVLLERGQNEKAIETLERALREQPLFAGESQDQATLLLRIANAHFYLSHYDESEALNQRVLEIYRKIYGNRHPQVADPLINLGAIAQERGRYGDAERYYREAFEINRDYYGSSHPEVAASLRGIGKALLAQKRFDEAEKILEEVLAVREHAYGPVHPNVASSLSDLGRIAMERGNLDEAERRFRRMAAIYQTSYGECHSFVGVALSNVAAVSLKRKEYVAAEQTLREVIGCYGRILPADHANLGISRARLGRALMGQHRYREAEVESSAALGILEKKVDSSAPDLVQVRKDLAEIHEALNQHKKAYALRVASRPTAHE